MSRTPTAPNETPSEPAAQALLDLLGQFGHEMRNALGAMSSAAELLQRGGIDASLAGRAADVIARQNQHLADLLPKLFDEAHVLAGDVLLVRQPLDLAELAERAAARLSPVARARLQLDLQAAWVEADAARIDQALDKLLSASGLGHGGAAHLTVKREGGAARLQLRGSAVAADAATPRAASLAQSIVRHIVELHGDGFEMTVIESGRTTLLALPSIDEPTALAARNAGRHVLLIGAANNEGMQRFGEGLRAAGHRAEVMVNVDAVLVTLQQQRPAALVIGLGRPAAAGFHLSRAARAGGFGGLLIALTSHAPADAIGPAMRAGFDMCQPLDIEPERLARLIADWR